MVRLFLGRCAALAAVVLVCGLGLVPGRLAAQRIQPLVAGGVEVTPDDSVLADRDSLTQYAVTFKVRNTGVFQYTFTLSCAPSGVVDWCENDLTQITLAAGASGNVPVYFTTGAPGALGTSGAVTLTASRTGMSDQGSVAVYVGYRAAAPVALLRPITDNLDRGLCFTSGAGEGAGLSCGDLLLTHGMPAYTTLGRDRSLALHYNSATATGLTLVPLVVRFPLYLKRPTSIRAVLEVTGPGGTTVKDSTTYPVPAYPTCTVGCSDSLQAVLGRGADWSGLPTGYYPMTVSLRTIYSGVATYTATTTGTLLVVNRSASEYGKGWGLLGVEQLLVPAQDTTVRVWVAGDGSARTYHRGAGLTAGQLVSGTGLTSFSAANSVDGNLATTAWSTSGATATTAAAVADLGAGFPQAVTSARLYATTASNATYAVEYSANNSTWTAAVTGYRPPQGWSSVVWTSVGAYRYWRLRVTANNGVSSTISELSFGGANTFYGAPGDAPDSLVRYDTLGVQWYRRPLRHGGNVTFDATGRHRVTVNRVGARTVFTDTTLSGGLTRLSRITVPPDSGTARQYRLTWNAGTGLLDSLTDPVGRGLRATMTSGTLTKLRDPGALDSTTYSYDGRGVLIRQALRRQAGTTQGDTATTRWTYARSARVTRIAVQTDAASVDSATTLITPWDEYGLDTLMRVDTAGLATRLDGPLPDTADAVDIRFDRFGQMRRLRHVGLGTVTLVKRDSVLSLPALATEIRSPHPTTAGSSGVITRLSWDPRGNLVEQRDSSSHLAGGIGQATRFTKYVYADPNAPNSPSRVEDALGRGTTFWYSSLGLPDSTTDARGLRTRFFLRASGPFKGLADSIALKSVEEWRQDSLKVVTSDQMTRLTYDANGNGLRVTSPVGVTTSYVTDATGRVTDIYGPDSSRSSVVYDALNRVTSQTRYTTAQAHPGGVNPLQGCVSAQVTCSFDPYSIDSLAATLTTTYRYNVMGLDSVADPRGVSRVFRRDARGLLVREGNEFSSRNEYKYSWYGSGGLLDSTRTSSRFTVRHLYDGFGRDTATVLPAQYGGAVPADTIRTTYDLLGRPTLIRNRVSTIARSYYATGEVRSKVTTLSGVKDSSAYVYDPTGARTYLYQGIPDSASSFDQVRYVYSATTGNMDSLVVTWGNTSAPYNTPRRFSFTYDVLGRRRTVTYPAQARAMTVTLGYDRLGGVRSLVSAHPGDPVDITRADLFDFSQVTLTADPLGRAATQRTSCAAGVVIFGAGACRGRAALTLNVINRYNRLGMLTRQSRPNEGGADTVDVMAYDASGNMVKRDGQRFLMVSASNRVLKDSSAVTGAKNEITWDSAGARIEEYAGSSATTNRKLYYDALGRLTGTESYKVPLDGTWGWGGGKDLCNYDADGQLARPCDADWLYFDGANVTRTGDNNLRWRIVHGGGVDDPLIAFFRKPNGVSGIRELYYVTDGQGRQYAVADSAGEVDSLLYNAYQRSSWTFAGGTQQAQSFNAARQGSDDVHPLSFFRNRAYDPATGRWIQEDPIGIAGGLNLYQFSGNNPATYSDPFGLCIPWPTCAFAMAGAGARAGTFIGGGVGTLIGAPGPGTLTGAAIGRVVGATVLFGVGTYGAYKIWQSRAEEREIRALIEQVTGKKASDADFLDVSEEIHRLKARGDGGTKNDKGDFTKKELRDIIRDVLGDGGPPAPEEPEGDAGDS